MGFEVTSYKNERPTGQKQQLFDGRTLENKGKLILTNGKVEILNYNNLYGYSPSSYLNRCKIISRSAFVFMNTSSARLVSARYKKYDSLKKNRDILTRYQPR